MEKEHLFAILFFILSLPIRAMPILIKGFPPGAQFINLVLAKNFFLTGRYSMESSNSIILASNNIIKEGIISSVSNKLGSITYAKLFSIFGFNHSLPWIITLIVSSLTLIVLYYLVLRLFDFKTAALFALLLLFLPIAWYSSLYAGFYELGLLFFSIALFFFFSKSRFRFVLTGIFLTLASLYRNAFLLSIPAFLIFSFFHEKKRKISKILTILFIFVILWSIYLLPSYFKEGRLNNRYITNFLSKEPVYEYEYFGHLFPDPYIYQFEKEEFIQDYQKKPKITFRDYSEADFLSKFGVKPTVKQKAITYLYSIWFYFKQFFIITMIGGPLFVFFLILGFINLYKRNRPLFIFFLIWLFSLFSLLIILTTDNWDHYLEILFLIGILISLGSIIILNALNKNKIISYLFLLMLLFQLVSASYISLGEEYRTSNMDIVNLWVDRINKANLSDSDVIAVTGHLTPYKLNYYTDKNFITFDPNTIKKLINENKLEEIFKLYNITHILGYDEELTRRIKEKTTIKII